MRILSALVLLALLSFPSFAADPVRLAASVGCDDKVIAQKLAAAINAELTKVNGVQVVDKLPQSKLLVFAKKDEKGSGWSIAITHMSNVETYFLGSKLLQSEQSDAVAVKPVLSHMVERDGFLTRLDVVHFDGMTDTDIGVLARSVVTDFLAKLPAPQKP